MVIIENYRLLDGEDAEELLAMDRHLKAHILVFVSQLWANIETSAVSLATDFIK